MDLCDAWIVVWYRPSNKFVFQVWVKWRIHRFWDFCVLFIYLALAVTIEETLVFGPHNISNEVTSHQPPSPTTSAHLLRTSLFSLNQHYNLKSNIKINKIKPLLSSNNMQLSVNTLIFFHLDYFHVHLSALWLTYHTYSCFPSPASSEIQNSFKTLLKRYKAPHVPIWYLITSVTFSDNLTTVCEVITLWTTFLSPSGQLRLWLTVNDCQEQIFIDESFSHYSCVCVYAGENVRPYVWTLMCNVSFAKLY